MNVQGWVEEHPYLHSVARFEQLIDHAIDAAQLPEVPVPDATLYASLLGKGTPLLLGEAAPDLSVAAEGLRQVTEVLATEDLPEEILSGILEFRELSRETPAHAVAVIDWVIAPEGDEQDHPAVVRLLAWRVLRAVLGRAIAALSPVRESALWPRRECPTCGSVASLAQFVEAEGGRERTLICGCCQTRWKYERFGCQYCGNEAPESLSIVELEDETQHRLDLCDSCGGYTKTFVGTDPRLFIQDWPTLHLDSIAVEKGYRRFGASLYDVGGSETIQ